jgi:hypothetical protein
MSALTVTNCDRYFIKEYYFLTLSAMVPANHSFWSAGAAFLLLVFLFTVELFALEEFLVVDATETPRLRRSSVCTGL